MPSVEPLNFPRTVLFFLLLAFRLANKPESCHSVLSFPVWARMAAYRIACKRTKSTQDTAGMLSVACDTAEEAYSLLNLQQHVLERVFSQLHLTDLARCCQVCKTLQSLVHQEGVWQSLCADTFPNFSAVELRQWISPPDSKYHCQSAHQDKIRAEPTQASRPQSYRSGRSYEARLCFQKG